MALISINPSTGVELGRWEPWDAATLEAALGTVAEATPAWVECPISERAACLARLAHAVRDQRDALARLAVLEMGKRIGEARAEVEKCAWACEHYAEHGAAYLADEAVATDAGSSYVHYAPLGTVLAVMPWNFPYWQFFRAAVPALIAGNTVVLKHASNVPQCAQAIERVWADAGLPSGVVRTLLIGGDQVAAVIRDPRIHAVTFTGSSEAGRAIASAAGAVLKKCVLELGGSDAFVVLEDADLDLAAETAVTARFQNNGQSCIAAKRFIVARAVLDAFLDRCAAGVDRLVPGDPLDEATTLGPLARADLRATLRRQVQASLIQGAQILRGGGPVAGPGMFYQASIVTRVSPGMPAFDEELFGPVAAVIAADDEAQALTLAAHPRYGLGGSVWTRDIERGERFARAMRCGAAFVNGLVKSDPRLPFGGIKESGYGRELGALGTREFVNAKTIWIR